MTKLTKGVRGIGLMAGLAIGGGALGACSSGSSSSSTTAGRTSTSGIPSNSSTTQAPSTTSTPAPSTTSTGPTRCATAGLVGSIVGSSGAAGTIETTVGLRSTATTPCILGGYPGLQMLGPGGATLPTNVVRKGNYSFTSMAPTTVTLSSGQSAYFNIGYSDVPVGNETSCPTSASLEVTPPNATDHLVVTATLSPCGGGTLVVSPVFLATGSNSQSTASGA
ncbi:MAG: DUF4232 domain-containing protein [Acidimicrobiales bacterium]